MEESGAKTLKKALQKSGDKLPSLPTIFNERTFPSKVEVMLTCVRCMEHYDPNYNSAKSCHIRIGTGSERPTLTAMSGSAHLVIRHGQQTDWMTSLNQIQRSSSVTSASILWRSREQKD